MSIDICPNCGWTAKQAGIPIINTMTKYRMSDVDDTNSDVPTDVSGDKILNCIDDVIEIKGVEYTRVDNVSNRKIIVKAKGPVIVNPQTTPITPNMPTGSTVSPVIITPANMPQTAPSLTPFGKPAGVIAGKPIVVGQP